jgi:predicted Ser/Thr protein kinase
MTDVKKCPQCGADLPADAPSGICPRCLLAVGMAGDTSVRGELSDDAPTTPLPGSARFVPPTPAALAHLFPQLEILEMIGAGGMGAVYKARQPGLDRLVAIKILPPEVGADPEFAQRFTREAQALARLSHQHIVPVYDFGVADGLYYFIMEYVDGANLRHLIKTGELKPPEALAIVPQICEALQFAHDEGVVHRDIKPKNILIDKRGRVKIADFGLARLLGTAAPELSLTGTHQVLGTLHYMAPEQVQGLRTVDHRADIFSLGVVFYELLTGELPMGHFEPPSKKVAIDVRLDEVVLRALAREPERRYQHANDVKTDIDSIASVTSAVPHSAFANSVTSPGVAPGQLNAADSADERQRAAELAEIAPDWLSYVMMGLFGLGWILIGLMWNLRHAAVAIAIFAMFLIFLWIVQRKLAYLPKLRLEIRRQPNWKSLINGTIVALVFFAGMLCVIAGQVTLADRMTDPSSFAPTSLDGTDAEAAVKSALRLAHLKGLGDESAKLWMRGGLINPLSWSNVVLSWFTGILLLFTAVGQHDSHATLPLHVEVLVGTKLVGCLLAACQPDDCPFHPRLNRRV